ncbi:MAG: mechanosensitive ion channel family protein, partial [Candidatus Obscuribacterales bacterium]|nr:mechanosensitive ion channel family protein [Candidatus Obscuribacterales bacterium]
VEALIDSASTPLTQAQDAILEYLPKLFTLIIIGLLSYGSMFIAKFFFNAMRDGTISLADFDPDWAMPTYKLARFTIFFFALVCALPYLPGWDTPAFKQLGLVVGVLISFGSSSAISNMMAGVVLTYTNAFRLGDRVRVADNIGDVIDKTLFVSKLKTPKGEIVSIPNAQILGSSITNYSAEGKRGMLILHTTVTIGYDVPWRQVHDALLKAAAATPNVLAEPVPFVLQSGLDDFYVKYDINVYTDQPQKMLDIYSQLHANIQDCFFKAGLEIMSPHYTSIRDGNRPAIPAEFLPADFVENSFKLKTLS